MQQQQRTRVEQGGPPFNATIAPPVQSESFAPLTRSDQMRAEGEIETEPACWTPEHDYQPSEDRSVIRTLRLNPGVTSWDDFTVTPTQPASWNVNVGPGRAVIDGTISPWLQGSYVCYAPDSRRVPVEPAHPTLERFDVVILHVVDQENSTEEGFGWRREVVTGEPGSGIPPELPPNSLALWGLRIPAASSSITAANWWPGLWPSAGDLRRPTGPVLIDHWTHVTNTAVTGTTGNPQAIGAFDLQVPQAWRGLALWPFDVIMEVTATGAIRFPGNQAAAGGYPITSGRVDLYFDVRGSPTGRRTWPTTGNTGEFHYFAMQEFQIFTVGQMPDWRMWVAIWGTLGGSGSGPPQLWLTIATKIYPRGVTTHRASLTT